MNVSDRTPVDGAMNSNNIKELVTVALTRHIHMFAKPLVQFTDLFLLHQYSILFL